jgi:hypothetical protein
MMMCSIVGYVDAFWGAPVEFLVTSALCLIVVYADKIETLS